MKGNPETQYFSEFEYISHLLPTSFLKFDLHLSSTSWLALLNPEQKILKCRTIQRMTTASFVNVLFSGRSRLNKKIELLHSKISLSASYITISNFSGEITMFGTMWSKESGCLCFWTNENTIVWANACSRVCFLTSVFVPLSSETSFCSSKG